MDTSPNEFNQQTLTSVQPRQIGAIPLLLPILDALALRVRTNALVPTHAEIDLGQVLVLLILNRLLAPQPLYGVQDWLPTTVLPEVLQLGPAQCYDQRLGRALDRLYPQLGELWAQLATQAIRVYDLDLTVLHWDLTSLYFEGAYTDSRLAAYGYSRDQRPDAKQVTLQVDVTHEDAVPVLYAVLPGNTADITRPIPHLQALLRFLARAELSDRRLRPILVSFYCPILYKDEDVSLCKAHIVNQAFHNTSRAWTVQRADVDNFYGRHFEADFTILQDASNQTGDDIFAKIFADKQLYKRLSPRILLDGGTN